MSAVMAQIRRFWAVKKKKKPDAGKGLDTDCQTETKDINGQMAHFILSDILLSY